MGKKIKEEDKIEIVNPLKKWKGHFWYVVKAISGQEKVIKQKLETDAEKRKLQDYLIKVEVPTIAPSNTEVRYSKTGKKIAQREKLFFPGYVLVCADITHPEVLPLIQDTPSVLGFLGENENMSKTPALTKDIRKMPTPLRDSEVRRILGTIDDENIDGGITKSIYEIGQTVKIMGESAFKGLEGIILGVFEDKKRLNIAIKIMHGNDTPIELGYNEVELIASSNS
jgi:transcriptional antiterminator NusG